MKTNRDLYLIDEFLVEIIRIVCDRRRRRRRVILVHVVPQLVQHRIT